MGATSIEVEDYWPYVENQDPLGYRSYDISNSVGRTLTIDNQSVTTDSQQSVSYGFSIGNHPSNYESFANLTTFTDAEQNVTTYGYDPNGRRHIESVTNAKNDQILTVGYDKFDRVTSVEDGMGNTADYALSGSHASIINPLLQEAESFFDRNGNQTLSIDERDRVTQYDYDTIDRLVRTTMPEDNYVDLVYDDFHNVVSKTAYSRPDQNGQRQTIQISAQFNFLTYTNPSVSHSVDINTLTWWEDARGNRTNLNYYPNGYIHKVKAPCLDETTTCSDSGRPVTVYAYNSLGQVDTLTDPEGKVTKSVYDSIANNSMLLSVTDDFGGVALQTSYTYDSHGNVETLTDGRGNTTTNSFDGLRRLKWEKLPDADGSGGDLPLVTVNYYDAIGGLVATELRSGSDTGTLLSRSETDFDLMGRPEFTYNKECFDTGGVRVTTLVGCAVTQTSYDAMGRTDIVCVFRRCRSTVPIQAGPRFRSMSVQCDAEVGRYS